MRAAERIREINPFFVMKILTRAQALERQGRRVIHMEIGEPDFPTPHLVVEAALAFIRNGDVKYTPSAGLPELREAIAAYYGRRYGIQVAGERILVTPGASGGLLLSLGLLLGSGGKIGLADPGYPCYSNLIRIFDGIPCRVPVDETTGFQLDVGLLRNIWDDRMTGIVMASPANPTGSIMAPRVLKELLDYVEERAGYVISDEVYHGLEYERCAHTALEFSPRALVVNSFSKYFGMTGWRLGWVVVPEELTEAAERLAQNLFISAPAHSQVAALASFSEENLRELEQRRLQFRERRDFLYSGLREIGFRIQAKPEGAFYILAECSQFSGDSYGFAMDLLEEAGVATAPGLDFGIHHPERYLRFSYTLPIARLAEGLERIAAFVHRAKPKASA